MHRWSPGPAARLASDTARLRAILGRCGGALNDRASSCEGRQYALEQHARENQPGGHGHDDQKCVAPLVAMLVSRAAGAVGPIETSSTRSVAALNRKKPGINETTAEKATAAKSRCRRSTTGVGRCPLWCAFRTRVGHRVRSEKSHERPPTSSARSGGDGGTTRPIARLEASARHRQRRVAAKFRGVG